MDKPLSILLQYCFQIRLVAIQHGVWFVAYDWAKRHLTDLAAARGAGAGTGDPGDPVGAPPPAPAAVPVVAGAFAATMAWGVGYPFDTIKTRIQAWAHSHSLYSSSRATPGHIYDLSLVIRWTEKLKLS